MKGRLPFLLLGLVIFATAALSLVASRSLRQEETLAQRQLQELVAGTVRAAAARIDQRLGDELDQLRNGMADAVAARGDLHLIRSLAARIEASRPLVADVYLYMNPWGFVWPTEETTDAAPSNTRAALLAELRRLTVAPLSGDGTLAFTLEGTSYLFASLDDHKGFYVGCALAPSPLEALVVAALQDAGGGGVALGVEGRGLFVQPWADEEGVIVRDSLGQEREAGHGTVESRQDPLLVRPLPAPLTDMRLFAYAQDPEAARRTVALRVQLYGWGIVMLALGIVGGAAWLLAEARAEIQRARAGRDFAIGVSHDLRTPIASMRILAESLYLGHVPDPGRQREFLHTIMEECERLSQLTERVLFLFRFGQDAMHYHLRDGDVGRTARAVVEAFAARYFVSGQVPGATGVPDVRLEIAESLPPVRLDDAAVQQVLLNLLDNAAKYGRPDPAPADGRIPVTVAVGTVVKRQRGWRRRRWVRIAVRDQGRGLTRAEQRKVFRRFYRAAESRRDHVAGLGLGLSVCQHAARAHGGWMEVLSEPGQGCSFVLYLPVLADRTATTGGGDA